MSSLLDVLQEKLSGKNVKIVLPEGEDERVLTNATQLQATDYVTPVVLGDYDKINLLAKDKGLDVSDIEIINPSTSELKPELVKSFVERRKGKATEEQVDELLNNVNYFGTMLVYAGHRRVSKWCDIQLEILFALHYKSLKRNQAYLKLLVSSL